MQSSYGKAEWLAKDGLGGRTELVAVSMSIDHSQLFIVLDHETEAGDAKIREFKVLRLQDLTGRGDCALERDSKEEKKGESRGGEAESGTDPN